MRSLKVVIWLCLLSSAGTTLVDSVHGQERGNRGSKAIAEISNKQKNKQPETLQQIHSLVERVFRFQKLTPKINGLVAFGDFLWKIDQPYAKSLFLRSWDFVDAEASLSGERRQDAVELPRLRGLIITRLSRHDPALALKLSERNSEQTEPRDKLRSAMSALEGGATTQQAIKLAEQGWDGRVAGSTLTLLAFLQKLRRTEPAAANEFYLRVVGGLANQPAIDANDLLTIGIYIYNSPLLAMASDPAVRDKDGVALYMQIGDALVIDVTANRPNIPLSLVRAYLSAAVNVLTRSDRITSDTALDAAALRLLLVKGQNSMPEVIPAITARLNLLAGPSTTGEVDQARYTTNAAPDMEEEIASLDDLSGEARDEKLFVLAFSLYRSGDFKRARNLADQISDLSSRQKVLDALSFGAAAKQLEEGDAVRAEALANALPVSAARAILRIAIVSHYAKTPDKGRALEAATVAANDCRRLENDRRKPYLLLALASAATEIDSSTAIAILKEAVTAFNNAEKLYVEWSDTIQVGYVQREFPLSLKLVDKEVTSCIEKLTRIEPDATISLLATLNDEGLQGDSLVAFSRSLWKREVLHQ